MGAESPRHSGCYYSLSLVLHGDMALSDGLQFHILVAFQEKEV